MAWLRPWIGVSLIAMSGGMLTGCASDLPVWAQSPHSYANDMSMPAEALVRLQRSEGGGLTVQPPTPAPMAPLSLPPPPQFIVPKVDSNIQQVSARGMVRVQIRAWVNGVPIFDEEVMNMAGPDLARLSQARGADASDKMAQVINAIVEQLIDQEVMYQDAMRKLEKQTGALKQLKGFVEKEFDKTVEKWRNAKPPIPEIQIKEMEPIARRLLQRNLVSTEYARARIMDYVKGAVNMELIREYYDTHKNEFRTVDKVVWQNVFIPVSPNLPTVDAAKRFAEGLVGKCRKSDDFSALLVYNEGPTKLNNHEGFGQRRGEIRPAELEAHLFNLREGDIGPVIAFPTGVHLMRVVKREYEAQLPLDDKTQTAIRKKLEGLLADQEYKRIVRELRGRAVIVIERPR